MTTNNLKLNTYLKCILNVIECLNVYRMIKFRNLVMDMLTFAKIFEMKTAAYKGQSQ